ncbi:periplasmic heavy metal sensor [Natroniella sulfidigena]|uniref:Spy/CpxP family protein refolding chaperone n=1 Tax=Natroniella sulfidigena TaxID=723921 RepID=UPI00200A7002|nr:periplasmic heavy metal sensor [Natroniella sulfidigena]MCK8817904.1 periplasmic heavy metal sensor [Natroniella sulfidigena]
MKRIISLVLVGLLVLGMSSVVFGYGRAGTRGHMMSQGEYSNYNLDLSDEQLEEMRALEDEYYQQTRELKDQLRRKRDDLRYLYSQADASQDELARLQNEISILNEELRSLQDEYQLAKRDVLSAEQLEKMNSTDFDCHGTNGNTSSNRRDRGNRGSGMMSGW